MKIKNFFPLLLLLLLTVAQKCDKGAIWLNQRCVNCRDILNTAEIPMDSNHASNKCRCKLGFVWVSQDAECRSISVQKNSKNSSFSKQLTSSNNILSQQSLSRFLQTLACNTTNGFIAYRMQYYKNSNPTVCYNCRLIPYGLNAASSSTCSCQTGFDYYAPWTTCYCYAGSYIDTKSGRCLGCAPMGNLISQCNDCEAPFGLTLLGCVYMPNLSNGGSGTCPTGYTLNFLTASCVCDFINDYSVNQAGTCTTCPQNDTNCINCRNSYVNDGVQCIHGSFIPNFDHNTTFACRTGHTFKVHPFTSQIVSCACSASAKFYQNGNNCVSCQTPPSGVTVASCQSCLNSASFYRGSVQCIYCPGVFLALGTASANGCDCPANYFWNANTGRCECDFALGFIGGATSNCTNCQNIANTDDLPLPNACSCLPGFKWNPQTNTCDCDTTSSSVFTIGGECVNCASMVGSTQTIADNKMSCACVFGYYWNPALRRCVCDYTKNYAMINGLCSDCKQAVMSNGLANNFGCVCTNGFTWNPTSGQCRCPSGSVIMGTRCVTCATASLPAGATVNDCGACSNSRGYASNNMGCFACAFQQGANSAVTNGVCTCMGTGTVWRPSLGACACDWSQLYYSRFNVAGGFSCSLCSKASTNPSQCVCDTSYFILDLNNNICTDASVDPNGSGTAFTFSCNSGFFWSQNFLPYRCLSGFSAFLGYLSSSPSRSLACNSSSNANTCSFCDTASGYLFISGSNQCLLCSTVTGSNGTATPNSCACNSGLWWNGITLACDAINCSSGMVYNPSTRSCACDPITSVVVNSKCISCASINNSHGFAVSVNSCGCISPNLWVASSSGGACTTLLCNPATQLTINNTCFTCPSSSNFGTGSVNGSVCGCIANYVWMSTETGGRCACDLSRAYLSGNPCVACPSGTTGGDGRGGCLCSGSNFWQGSSCSSCSAAANVVLLSNGTCFTCGAAGTYTGSKISSSVCACVPTSLRWNSNGACDCGPTSAMIIRGTTFTCFACSNATAFTSTKASSTSCTCISSNLRWNPQRTLCDCGSQPNSIVFGSGSAARCITCTPSIYMVSASADLTACVCVGRLIWNSAANTCGCSNAQTMVIIGNASTTQCVTCSAIQFGRNVANSTSCNCLGTGLVFNPLNGTCACPAGSIILPNFTCAACPANSPVYTTYECLCPQGSIWTTANVCLECGSSAIPNSVPLLGTNFACVCATGFIWDVMTLSCISSTSCNTATANCMRCPGGATARALSTTSVRNLAGGAAVQILQNGTFTNYNQIRNFMCPCSTGFMWDALRLGCYANGLQ